MAETNGYVVIYKPDHPKASSGRIYEHVLVAEKMMGRPLADNEDVHHLDFNRKNNLHQNLLVLDHGQHRKLHNFINRHGLREVFEATAKEGHHVRKCECCGEYLAKDRMFCDKECQSEYKRKQKPTKEELEELYKDMTQEEISKVYSVHPSTISSWLRGYKQAEMAN